MTRLAQRAVGERSAATPTATSATAPIRAASVNRYRPTVILPACRGSIRDRPTSVGESGHLDADVVLRRRVGESQGSQFVKHCGN
jgi:hypothetical protein